MIYLGTTGWLFDHWEGSFYPKTFEGDKLEYYSKISAFTELPSTFTRIPDQKKVQYWYDSTPDDFIFVLRMLRAVTLNSKYEVKTGLIEKYLQAVEPLSDKAQLLLLHFPVKFQKGPKQMEFLLEMLDLIHSKFNGSILVEAPNRSWQKEEVKEVLHERSACLAGNDRRPIPSLMRDEDIYYLRLLGDKRTVPKSMFGKKPIDRTADLKYWADHLKVIDKRTKLVFLALDNHFSGDSAADAYQIAQNLKELGVEIRGFDAQE